MRNLIGGFDFNQLRPNKAIKGAIVYLLSSLKPNLDSELFEFKFEPCGYFYSITHATAAIRELAKLDNDSAPSMYEVRTIVTGLDNTLSGKCYYFGKDGTLSEQEQSNLFEQNPYREALDAFGIVVSK